VTKLIQLFICSKQKPNTLELLKFSTIYYPGSNDVNIPRL